MYDLYTLHLIIQTKKNFIVRDEPYHIIITTNVCLQECILLKFCVNQRFACALISSVKHWDRQDYYTFTDFFFHFSLLWLLWWWLWSAKVFCCNVVVALHLAGCASYCRLLSTCLIWIALYLHFFISLSGVD